MIAFIDDHRDAYGVEPICRVLPIAPSTYHERVAQRQDPTRLSARVRRDVGLKPEIARVFAENFEVYGVRKVWRQMMREGFPIARCTVARLMREMGLVGVIRSCQPQVLCASAEHAVGIRLYLCRDLGRLRLRRFRHRYLRQADRRLASQQAAHASFVLDALEQALHDRRPIHRGGLIHHSDRGSQYLSIKYTERLVEAGIEPSVGSVGDSYDNA